MCDPKFSELSANRWRNAQMYLYLSQLVININSPRLHFLYEKFGQRLVSLDNGYVKKPGKKEENIKTLTPRSFCDSFHHLNLRISDTVKFQKISPSMYRPLQISAPQTGNAKNPPFNRPSKYKPPGGLYVENCPQIQSKTQAKQKR